MKIFKNKWQHVCKCLKIMMDQSDRHLAAYNELMIAPESPLIEPLGIVEAQLIKSLSMLVDDVFYSIEWYVYECDYGRKPMEAGSHGNLELIDSTDKLKLLIEGML